MLIEAQPISVILLTGFLGAGKRTFLNELLLASPDQKVLVIENEWGEQGLDSQFLTIQPDKLIELNQGCVCCSAQDQLMRILGYLIQEQNRFDTLIIEATGLADPAPLILAFGEDDLRQFFELQSVVTLLDTKHFWQQHQLDRVCLQQIALADTLLLNKADLVTEGELQQLSRYLSSINPLASQLITQFAKIQPNQLQAHQSVVENLALHQTPVTHKGWMAASLTCPGVMDPDALSAWLGNLMFHPAQTILRLKGIVTLASSPLRRYVLQGVCSRLEGRPDRPWRDSEVRLNQLVLIGAHLETATLQQAFEACLKPN